MQIQAGAPTTKNPKFGGQKGQIRKLQMKKKNSVHQNPNDPNLHREAPLQGVQRVTVVAAGVLD